MTKRLTLQLDLDEYVETWIDIITTLHDQIISDDEIYLPLSKKVEPYKISFELKTILLVIAMQAFKGSVISVKVQENVENAIVDKFYVCIAGSDTEALISSKEYYHSLMDFFKENGTYKKNMVSEEKVEALQNDTISQTRYFISKVTGEKEEKNKEIIEKAGIALLKARAVFSQLASNSTIDANSLIFKRYRFYVKG